MDYDPSNVDLNQEHAQKAMRALRAHAKVTHAKLKTSVLTIGTAKISLSSHDGSKVIMRHSTTRIAYSTVDTERPKTFAYGSLYPLCIWIGQHFWLVDSQSLSFFIYSYVAVVKDTKLALCHVFSCKNQKQGYEMTFVCAHAFDTNYRKWQENRAAAASAAASSEASDVEPSQAWQKKKSPLAVSEEENGGGGSKEDEFGGGDNATPAASELSGNLLAETSETSKKEPAFLAIMDGQDPAELAGQYFEAFGISLIEEDDDEDPFTTRAQETAEPNLLEVGVDTGLYNQASIDMGADGDAGYVTVGQSFNFVDDGEGWDD